MWNRKQTFRKEYRMTERIKGLEENIAWLKKNLRKQASGVFHYRMKIEQMEAEIENLRQENVELKARLYDVMSEKTRRNRALLSGRTLPDIMALAAHQVSTEGSEKPSGDLGPVSWSSVGSIPQERVVSSGCFWRDYARSGKSERMKL